MAQDIKIERYANSEEMRRSVGRLITNGWVVQRITSGFEGWREVELHREITIPHVTIIFPRPGNARLRRLL